MFDRFYWDTLSDDYKLPGSSESCTLHAIWPSSVDFDACFAEAGFEDFADSDSNWDANWKTLVRRVLSTLSQYGDPVIRNPVTAIIRTSIWDRIRSGRLRESEDDLTLVQQIVLATTDSQFGQAVVNFGEKPDLTLICGDGHPIFWLLEDEATDWSFTDLVDAISVDCHQQRRSLQWQHLIPSSVQL